MGVTVPGQYPSDRSHNSSLKPDPIFLKELSEGSNRGGIFQTTIMQVGIMQGGEVVPGGKFSGEGEIEGVLSGRVFHSWGDNIYLFHWHCLSLKQGNVMVAGLRYQSSS